MPYKNLIDNERVTLASTLREIAPNYRHLSIATGYWDLHGTLEVLDLLEGYDSIRLLIGQEPLSHRLQASLKLSPEDPESLFPDKDVMHDLVEIGKMSNATAADIEDLRCAATRIAGLIEEGKLEVKVFRKPRLHAKAYIFGTFASETAVGIVGSSNFTKAGLCTNRELNSLEDDHHIVLYQPQNQQQEHGHLSWFEQYWNDPEAVEWSGDFSRLLGDSPLGDLTFGAYDVYIKTLMEVFPDELVPPQELSEDTEDVLYAFQNRNAGILLNKLNKMGVAMLSDSVGLGKTITAGAVVKHYSDNERRRIVVIAPAALKQQWRDDLALHFGLAKGVDFELVSLQDQVAIEQLIEEAEKPKIRPVDLFVVDEAHNLRSSGSARYQAIEQLFSVNPNSHVLMLTATPINNSLMDFAHQIQLGSKGELSSVSVPYVNNSGEVEWLEFFDALKNVQSEVKKAEREGRRLDWGKYKKTLAAGLRHYLVRSTRQGVEAEGGIVSKDGSRRSFPKSSVEQMSYQYKDSIISLTYNEIHGKKNSIFEGIDPCLLNIDTAAMLTQQSLHPLDFLKEAIADDGYLAEQFALDPGVAFPIKLENGLCSVIPNVFQAINFLGFTPYRPDIYNYRYHTKSLQQIRDLGLVPDERRKIQVQLVIHNILHVSWLKRLESSSASLLKSVQYYLKRLALFEKYLDMGHIVTLADANTLEKEYEADIDQAFQDFEKYLDEVQAALDSGASTAEIKRRGVERRPADPKVYNLVAMRKDLARDRAISELLVTVLSNLSKPENNSKLQELAKFIERITATQFYGNKVLVFSFFSDTIDYLENNLPALVSKIQGFEERSAFITGNSAGTVESRARRFSPKAKNYKLKDGETEIDFLFATDVLSEGQNLQDAGILINYDLHWNPVRMIQRNGRINRLGSQFSEVVIANAKPHDDLELYLRLVRRLERKIDTIKNSIGTDQSVLGEDENPIEFIDYYSDDKSKASVAAEQAAQAVGGQTAVLDFEDEFSFELRRFLAEHKDDEEIKRIMAIPLGKWNYLPQKENGERTCLALERVIGRTSITGAPINETLFVRVDTSGAWYKAEHIEDTDALSIIKTTPDDNSRARDAIGADRLRVANRAATTARIKAESVSSSFDLKPKMLEALTTMTAYVPLGTDLQSIVRNGIRNASHKREFERLVRKINAERSEHGSVFSTTVSRFERLMNELLSSLGEGREIDDTESVLFYHSPEDTRA